MWAAGRSLSTRDLVADVTRWVRGDKALGLQHRPGVDVSFLEGADLARVLPPRVGLPRCARWRGQPWSNCGYRLILPAFDAGGRMESFHALQLEDRNRLDENGVPWPKSLWPLSNQARGLVFADQAAQLLFAGADVAPGLSARDFVRRAGLVIVEGGPDFLAAVSAPPPEDVPLAAVVGVTSGAWREDAGRDLAARVPAGTRVTLAVHMDPAGDKYARDIAASFGGRCIVERIAPGELFGGWLVSGRGAA